MTTETEMHRIIGTALWNEGIKGKYVIDETGITGLVINTDDGSEFQITIVRSRTQAEPGASE